MNLDFLAAQCAKIFLEYMSRFNTRYAPVKSVKCDNSVAYCLTNSRRVPYCPLQASKNFIIKLFKLERTCRIWFNPVNASPFLDAINELRILLKLTNSATMDFGWFEEAALLDDVVKILL